MGPGELVKIRLDINDGCSTPFLCLIVEVNYINERMKKRRNNWSQWAELTVLHEGSIQNIALYWDDDVQVISCIE